MNSVWQPDKKVMISGQHLVALGVVVSLTSLISSRLQSQALFQTITSDNANLSFNSFLLHISTVNKQMLFFPPCMFLISFRVLQ